MSQFTVPLDKSKLVDAICKYLTEKKLALDYNVFNTALSPRQPESIWGQLCRILIESYDFYYSWKIQTMWTRHASELTQIISQKSGIH